MHETTRKLLEKLLAHAESEESTGRRRAFNLTLERARSYFQEPDLVIKQQVHSELLELQRQSIIDIRWDPRAGGERGLVVGLSASSPAALASTLGIIRLKDALAQAEALFAPYLSDKRLALALNIWRNGRQIRATYGASDAQQVLEAYKVVAHCRTLSRPTAIRRISSAMFGRSKRLERWESLIDFLTASTDEEAIVGSGLSSAEIFGRINLIRFAQPFLMAGLHRVSLTGVGERDLARPYEGVSADTILALSTHPSYILSVENLTTFHELAAARPAGSNGLIVFTSGNFSPAFRQAYQRIAATSQCERFLHWGDVDWKGIEIMSRLSRVLHEANGAELIPWHMDRDPVEAMHGEIEYLDDRAIRRILRICERHGWDLIADAVRRHKSRVEQESQPLEWP